MEERERGVTSAEVRSEQSDMSALGGACEATSTTGSVSSAGWMELSGVCGLQSPEAQSSRARLLLFFHAGINSIDLSIPLPCSTLSISSPYDVVVENMRS